jgi:hypothetical protein
MMDMKSPRAKSMKSILGSVNTLGHGIQNNMVLVRYQGVLSEISTLKIEKGLMTESTSQVFKKGNQQ